ncbi:MAG: hypothetical protein OJF55_000241 [Rhodanobacteraceae bacterium]|nr:MAG: hypothetical protein OJF55_000241 [Rhodanobacteraceae bacterium]
MKHAMRILLVRVGADQSPAGGGYNGPVDTSTNQFVYVGIPELHPLHRGYERRYGSTRLTAELARMGTCIPPGLLGRCMHTDPDFEHATYGDHGRRAAQLKRLARGDVLVFYAGLRDVRRSGLVYALIGQLTLDQSMPANRIADPLLNVHAQRRRVDPDDWVLIGTRRGSGRYDRCIPVGEFRDGAYRVKRALLRTWGGLSVKDGFLQRSGGFPHFIEPDRFLGWLAAQRVRLVRRNF